MEPTSRLHNMRAEVGLHHHPLLGTAMHDLCGVSLRPHDLRLQRAILAHLTDFATCSRNFLVVSTKLSAFT